MADAPTTTAPSPDTALKCTNGQTLAEVFRAQGSPYQIDMPKLENNGQPLQEQVRNISSNMPEKAIIFTDADFREMFPDRRALDDVSNKTAAEFKANPQLMEKAEGVYNQYIDKMREDRPEVAAFNSIVRDDYMNGDKPPRTLPEFTESKIRALNAWENRPMLLTKPASYEGEPTYLVKTSDPSVGLQPAYEVIKSQLGLPIAPPPGRTEQQSALVSAHELEHLANGQQSATYRNVDEDLKNVAAAGCPIPSAEAARSIHLHAVENEAAISNVQAARDVVPEGLARWKAAANIALSNEENMIERQKTGAFDKHDMHSIVGFTEYEYIETGEIPNLYAKMDDVHNFYAKTADMFRDSVEMAKAKAGIAENVDIGVKPSIPLTMDVVRQALKAEPPIYSPAEQVIAQNYLQAMGEDLDIQPQDLHKTLDAQAQDFKNTVAAPSVKIAPEI